jgi:Raf kinase inhibitor-like YbhB/YbcL family protein
MRIVSPAFEEGASIPRKYTCQGVDINPPLSIADVPAEAKSIALIVDDPDVPKSVRADRMWVHWVAYDIEPAISEIKEGAPSLGTQGKNTGGQNRYMGPCPPDREHRYFFKLYALDSMLNLKEGATKEELLKAMEGHVLEEALLMGRYEQD